MNAPLAPEHLTPELHEALGRVTLDDNLSQSGRKLCRSYKYAAGAASGLVGEREAR